MVAHLTEEEQLDALKRWWKENGKGTVAVIAIMLAGFFGWNKYQDHKITKANEGSVIFERFIAQTATIDKVPTAAQESKIKAIAAELSQHSKTSLYNDFSQMYLAKLAVEKGDLDSAISTLEQVSTNSKDAAIQDLARLRFARLLAAKGEADKALSALDAKVEASYAAAYQEAKGDILLGENRIQDAHTAYKTALDSMSDDQFMRKNLVQLKIDHTAVATKPSLDAPQADSDASKGSVTEAGDA